MVLLILKENNKLWVLKLTMGAMTLIASHGESKEIAILMMIEGNGFGIKYDMGGGMTIAAATIEAEDD